MIKNKKISQDEHEAVKLLEDLQKDFPDERVETIPDILKIDVKHHINDQNKFNKLGHCKEQAKKFIADENDTEKVSKTPLPLLTEALEKEIVERINKDHFFLTSGSKAQYYYVSPKNGKISSYRRREFLNKFENKKVRYSDQKRGEKVTTEGQVWLNSPERKTCEEIVFEPGEVSSENNYNIWQGFNVKSKKGDVSIFRDFVKDIICNGNEEDFKYVWSWCAQMFQKPGEIGETALVLIGKQGTGKNTFVEIIGHLLGNHFVQVTGIEQLLGRFDFHHAQAILLFANEALWGGDRRSLGRLKTLITEKEVLVEQKYKDAVPLRNYRRLILASNEDFPVHLDRDDRRFFVLNISDKKKEDSVYFDKLCHWAENGGYESLLHYFLNYDLTQFNIRAIPQNKAAFNLKIQSAPSAEKYFFYIFSDGQFHLKVPDIQLNLKNSTTITRRDLYNDYSHWCEAQKIRDIADKVNFGKALKKIFPKLNSEKRKLVEERSKRAYELPNLIECRKCFEELYQAGPHIWGD